MTNPEKSCYSGSYKAEKKHINGGEQLEKLEFDTNTGNITCYAENKKHSEETQAAIDKAEHVTFWLAVIAIEVLACLLVAGL